MTASCNWPDDCNIAFFISNLSRSRLIFKARLTADPTSRWTPLVLAVSFPLLGRIRNFHPLVTCAARHTNKKEPCTITRSFSLSYILIYDHELLNIPLIHVFSTYMLGILRIHHPSLHYNMSEFHFLQYQRRLIYQPSPMSVSCQSTSVV